MKDNQLVLVITLIVGLFENVLTQIIDNQTLCVPFGARMSIGYFYTNAQNSSDTIDIQYNTNYSCPYTYIELWTTASPTPIQHTPIVSDLLNMSQIYQNFTPALNFTYFTYIHRVSLSLTEGETYYYQIFGNNSLEPVGPFNLKVPYRNTPNDQKIIFFGDMDSVWFPPNASNFTFDWFQTTKNTRRDEFDMLVFLGDMAYNLEAQDCYRGDFFLRNLSVFTPYWPLQISPGNHDSGNDTYFPMVRKLFWSPQQTELNLPKVFYNFYSWNLGYAHFISFNMYWIVYNISTADERITLYNAFLQDLITANKSREDVPWIIVLSHYPMYCSDNTNPMCGYNWLVLENYTKLFTEYGVDMYIGAHQHDYERDKPTINNLTANFYSDEGEHVIKDANAPLYIVEGAAGNNYYMPDEIYQEQPYTQYQSIQTGVGVLTIHNKTHLLWQQIDTETSQVCDFVYLVKGYDPDAESIGRKYLWLWITLVIIFSVGLVIGGYFFYQRRKMISQSPYTVSNSGAVSLEEI